MTRRLIILFFASAVFFSCSSNKDGNNEILNQDKMASVLYDVLLAESYVESYLMKDTTLSKDSLLKVEMDKVLKVYGISSKTFSESYLFYKKHPILLESVMDSAHERAVRGRTEIFTRRTPKSR